MKTKDLTLIGVMAALICVAGPLTVPIGPIPLSLASLAVYLAGAILGWKRGSLAVLIYLLMWRRKKTKEPKSEQLQAST